MKDALLQGNRFAALSTPLGPDMLALYRFDGREGLSELFEWRVEALTAAEIITESDLIGQSCSVFLDLNAERTRIFHGICTDVHWLGVLAGRAHYELIIRPWTWLLSLQTDSRIFHEQRVDQIIATVFDEVGFKDFKFRLTSDPSPIPYCVQYQESNLDFILRLMERHGLYYFFEHGDDTHTLVIIDNATAHNSIPGYDVVPYFPAGHAQQERDHLSQIHLKRRLRSDRVDVNDYNYERASTNLIEGSMDVRPHGNNNNALYAYLAGHGNRATARDRARVILEARRAETKRVAASGTAAGISAGYSLKIENDPLPERGEELLCVRARHRISSDTYRTEKDLSDEPPYSGSYEFMPLNVPFRAPQITPWPRIGGHQTAAVVGQDGEEIDVDEQGRILVHFHWERRGEASCRVRVAQTLAGGGFGAVQIPRIGHEVVVSFIDGDPDRPLVVGSVYNSDNRPPLDFPAAKTQMGFKSNSSKGGGGYNELILDDNKGSEGIRMHAQKNMDSVVENDQTELVKNDRTEEVVNDYSLKVGNNMTVEVENNRDTTINSGNETTTISSGNRTTTISSGSDSLSLPSGIRTQTIGTGSLITNIGQGAMMNNIGLGSYTTVVGVGPHVTQVAAGFLTASVTGPMTYTATAGITIESDSEIELKVGGSCIKITEAGIEIKAPSVLIDGDEISALAKGKMDLIANGVMEIKGLPVNVNC